MTGHADADETLRKQLAVVEERLVVEFADAVPAETIRQTGLDEFRRYDNARSDRARAPETMASAAVRCAAYHGRVPDDLIDASAPALMPLVSQNLSLMPNGIDAAISRAHAGGRRVRFWNVPASEAAWRHLLDAGVDWISTDDLTGLATFLRKIAEEA